MRQTDVGATDGDTRPHTPFRAGGADLLSHAMEGRRVAFGLAGGKARAGELVFVDFALLSTTHGASPLSIAYARVCNDAERVLGDKARYEVHVTQDGPHYCGFFWFVHPDFTNAMTWEELVPQTLEEVIERPIHGGGTFLAGRHTAPEKR